VLPSNAKSRIMSYNHAKRSAHEANGADSEALTLERGSDMVTATVEAHHWTREEYERAVEAGAFEGWKIELVEGVLVDMTPQGTPHSSAVRKLLRELLRIVPGGLEVQPQMPLAISEDSLPEPDIAVVPRIPMTMPASIQPKPSLSPRFPRPPSRTTARSSLAPMPRQESPSTGF